MSKLAILGGSPVRTKLFPAYNVIGPDEIKATNRVLNSGVLSKFIGAWHDDFYGGPEVQAFEKEWSTAFGTTMSVAVNSATSGLYAAIGAAGVCPGDEVIVPSLSMSASVTAAVLYGGIPVFADVNPETFNPCPDSIRSLVTPRTKAIMVVHLLGHPADMDPVMEVAREHGLTVIEDCAQSPFATYKGRLVGTIGHIGVFSLNFHKHIHTGEGGVCVTDDDRLGERLQMIRNHAEAVVAGKETPDLTNMIGFNFRMGEIEAAIGRSLLGTAGGLIEVRRKNAAYLNDKIGELPGLRTVKPRPDCGHVYGAMGMLCDSGVHGVPRDLLVKALRAELPATELREEAKGPLLGAGFGKPLYMLPMFQKQVAFGDAGYPFKGPHYRKSLDYSEGLCPAAEKACKTMVVHELMRPPMANQDLDDVATAFHKVFGNLAGLRDIADNDGQA